MSAASPFTPITNLTIGAADRKADAIAVEITRTANAVGSFKAMLNNAGNKFGATGFDVQNNVVININGIPIFGGWVDGPGTTFQLLDAEGYTTEYLVISGVDRMQDFLFHNNFEYLYPEYNVAAARIQQLRDILNDVINVQIGVGAGIGQTNISYTFPAGATPNVGGFEFREGNSFLGALQELHRRANYLFFVQDTIAAGAYPLQNGAPGFSASGVTLTEGVNILSADWNRRRGDKLYNYVRLYGKNPMFDAWTEYNSASWGVSVGDAISDDSTTVRVGSFSIRIQNVLGAPNNPYGQIDFGGGPAFNYASIDLSKGEVGFWAYYDGAGSAAASPIRVQLFDGVNTINYYGNRTRCYRAHWGWCTAPLGEDFTNLAASNQWWPVPGAGQFAWDSVDRIRFMYEPAGADRPDNLYIDGLSLPLPPISIVNNAGSEGTYRRRPYIDSRPDMRTQLALDSLATSILNKHETTTVDYVKIRASGNTGLHYGGQSVSIYSPSLGIDDGMGGPDTYYMTEVHHIIEPRKDISGGYGWDYITEIEAIPIDTRAPDFSRLNENPYKSAFQVGRTSGVGLKVK